MLKLEKHGERYWAIYDGHDLICITVYRKGAVEVINRLSTKSFKEKQETTQKEKLAF